MTSNTSLCRWAARRKWMMIRQHSTVCTTRVNLMAVRCVVGQRTDEQEYPRVQQIHEFDLYVIMSLVEDCDKRTQAYRANEQG